MAHTEHFRLQPKIYDRFDHWLEGKPDTALTWLLVAMAAFLLWVALFQQNRVLKALVIAWAVLP